MADKKSGVAAKVRALVEKPVTDAGYTLWDVSYYKEGPEMILEISIDKKEGVSINDCSAVTKIVEPLIDELDPIEESYCLQVSSAGTVRPLDREEHIAFVCDNGMPVNIGLYTALDGSKEFCGRIAEFDKDSVTLDTGEKQLKIDKKTISKITADFYKTDGDQDPEDEDKE
ncbi:MAG: ribosome maturation factor RimP [Clostridia bacterium]|nr:ribosome maturation factor RimP [Clostridia bacterium]